MITYTVQASDGRQTITSVYDNPAAAFAAAVWYSWDKTATVHSSDGRRVWAPGRHKTQRTPAEQEAASHAINNHRRSAYSCAPDKLPGRISHTENT